MKILQINKFNYIKGGADKYYLELSELLRKNNHKVVNFSADNLKTVDFSFVKFNLKLALRFIYSFEAKRKLKKIIKDEKPEVAHIHNIHHYLTPSILPVLKKYNIPIVQTVHDWQIICPNYRLQNGRNQICEKCKTKKYWHCVLNKCVKNSYFASFLNAVEMSYWNIFRNYQSYIDVFIAPSEFVKDKLLEWGILESKIKIVSHFLDKGEVKKRSGGYFVYVGRLVKEKAVMTLLEAFSKIPAQKLYIIGEGELETEIKKFVCLNKLKNIRLLGYKKGCELKDFISNAKAVIVPSEWQETFGYVVAEAQALSAPVIAANIGAIPELVRHQETGLLFRPGDKDDLIKQIEWFLANTALVKNIVKTAKKKILEDCNLKKHYLTILDIYGLLC